MKSARQTLLILALVWPAARAFHSIWVHQRGTASARNLYLNKYIERKRESTDATVRLQYSNSTMEEEGPRSNDNNNSIKFKPKIRWLDTERRPSSVDEYLEFLDRRYHNLNTQAKLQPARSSSTSFTPFKWMSSEAETGTGIRPRQDDAFKVLGVDGLASDRLLQKHAEQQDSESVTAPLTLSAAFSMGLRKRTKRTRRVVSYVLKRYQPKASRLLRRAPKMIMAFLAMVITKVVNAGLEIGGGAVTVKPTVQAVLILAAKASELSKQGWRRSSREEHMGEWQ